MALSPVITTEANAWAVAAEGLTRRFGASRALDRVDLSIPWDQRIAVLGHNADPSKRMNYNVPQAGWIEGIFSGTHGSSWDKDGNLYVQDWNVAGRIMKLLRVK